MKLEFFHTGSCRHMEYATRRGAPLRTCEYPMHAGVIERGGSLIVFDPGYAPRIMEATDPLPERLYRWFTPMQIPPSGDLRSRLGSRSKAVSHVVLSHFHADHMAGLIDFPGARIVCSRAGYEHFRDRAGFAAVRAGYLKALLPADFEERAIFFEDLPECALPLDLWPFKTGRDLFGDGSIHLLALPGHATGQIGASFTDGAGIPRLLIADASWSVPALAADDPPPWLTLRLLGSPAQYRETWARLRALHRDRPGIRLHACHCSHSARELLV